MLPAHVADRLSRQVRLIAAALVVVLLAAAAAAITADRSKAHSSPRYLGMHKLMLAAFDGKASLFLRLPPVTAASPKPNHASDIPLTSIGWGISEPVDVASGLPSGRFNAASFTVKKHLDQYTTGILGLAVTTKLIPTATIYVEPALSIKAAQAATSNEQLVYKLTNADVVSDQHSATTSNSTETVQFTYQKLSVTYLKNGKSIETVTYTRNLPG